MSDLSAWLLSVGAFGGIVVCTAIAAKSIAGDPPRGRRRCPRCWHELGPAVDAASSLQCAECGHIAGAEHEVVRTRRNPARAVLATLGVVAIALATRARMLDRGPWSMAPTALLIAVTPGFSDGAYRSATWELANRVRGGETTDAQVREAFGMFIDGDGGARPPSAAWRAKYRDLGSATMARLGPSDPLMQRLLEIPPAFEVSWAMGGRDAKADAPPLLFVDADVWWPPGLEGRLEVRFADGSTQLASFRPEGRYPPLIVEVPSSSKEHDAVGLTLAYRAIQSEDDARGWKPYPTVALAIPSLESEPTAPLRAVDRADFRAALRAAFDEGLAVWASGAPRAGLRFDHRLTSGEEFDRTAIGLRVEVLESGKVRRTSRIWWMGGTRTTTPRWLPSIEDAAGMGRLFDEQGELDERWTLRVSGDERLAQYARPPVGGSAEDEPPTAWFAGSFEMPLRVERGNAPAPVRRWKLIESTAGGAPGFLH